MLGITEFAPTRESVLPRAIVAVQTHGQLHLDNIVAHLPVIVRVIGLDGTYLLSEGQGLRLIGRLPGDRVGQSIFAVQHDRPDILTMIRRALAGEEIHFLCELNGYVWESQYTPLYEDGTLIGTVYVAMDITARARAEAALQESQARLHQLLDHTSELIQVTDPASHFDYVNRAWCATLGHDRDALHHLTQADICAPEAWPDYQDRIARLLRGEPPAPFETTFLTRDGRRIIVEGTLHLRSQAAGMPALWGTFRDITAQRKLETHLLHQATHDALTGLPNRAHFMAQLATAIARQPQLTGCVTIFFIDLDGFKHVNDQLGHAAGDVVLTVTARRLRRCTPAGATIGRLGGDEFAILLDHCADAREAVALATALTTAIAQPIPLGDDTAQIRASIGIARHDHPDTPAETLLSQADAMMYRAKQRGPGHYALAQTAALAGA